MLRQAQTHKAKLAGFTLIELMIAVAIVGILATIAATSYQRQVMQSHRTDARTALLDLAGREEKLFSTTNAYTDIPANLGYGTSTSHASAPTAAFPVSSSNGTPYYNVYIQTPDPNQGSAPNTYLITAFPSPGNSQAGDTTCTSLSVSQLGQQTATPPGTTPPGAASATCWSN
jgi:type IV pilus assembly protein PilE